MKKKTAKQLASIIDMCRDNNELTIAVLESLVELVQNNIESASEPVVNTEPEVEWYDVFKSEFTEVKVKDNVVTVKVARGHADEFRPQLRAAGFRWGRKCRAYWAWLDDEKRAEVARRNAENDALTEGMSYEERKAFWAERKARKSA